MPSPLIEFILLTASPPFRIQLGVAMVILHVLPSKLPRPDSWFLMITGPLLLLLNALFVGHLFRLFNSRRHSRGDWTRYRFDGWLLEFRCQ